MRQPFLFYTPPLCGIITRTLLIENGQWIIENELQINVDNSSLLNFRLLLISHIGTLTNHQINHGLSQNINLLNERNGAIIVIFVMKIIIYGF